jgi:hypothetical protein
MASKCPNNSTVSKPRRLASLKCNNMPLNHLQGNLLNIMLSHQHSSSSIHPNNLLHLNKHNILLSNRKLLVKVVITNHQVNLLKLKHSNILRIEQAVLQAPLLLQVLLRDRV